MKRLVIVMLSTFALWTVAAPTMAENRNSDRPSTPNTEDQENFGSQSTPTEEDIEPVTLVQLAYQGYFADQGIPSHAALKTAIATGDVDAETLVRSAINKGRLSSDTLNDDGYLNIVRTQLENLNDR
ncbi:hypothetical protein C7H19_06710 [Aphanothece hegewaldii CCALA 016]|uniref:Uncharacterized protein n=1 Tax=Aphanothece hegewaldii CCALA 016 TaxID=2107694 RepID=A0A2T1M0I2_9CHRO|nr:hypothetical protein [Aphanothece hegewaldii]PSF38157.1 hypothetical protein C7H19_06710 [Aphanothece hegewaldii CCALA 016]